MQSEWAHTFLDIFDSIQQRRIPDKILQSNLASWEVSGVRVHVLSPSEAVRREFRQTLVAKVDDPDIQFPDENRLSAVLALEFGTNLVLLGADAPRNEWRDAHSEWRNKKLPKACILKIPHHGSSDTVDWRGGKSTAHFLEMCLAGTDTKAVLFAGDYSHPSKDVYERLIIETDLFCLGNGLKSSAPNPLRIKDPRAKAVQASHACQPVVVFEIGDSGPPNVTKGFHCNGCPRS